MEEGLEQQREDIYIPGLTQPGLFQQLPNLRGFEGLVPKDVAHGLDDGRFQETSSLELIQSSSWRRLAHFTFHEIIHSDPSHTRAILQLWAYRFKALDELGLARLIQREMLELFRTISRTLPLTEVLLNLGNPSLTGNPPIKPIPDLAPFDILLLRARLPILLQPTHRHPHLINHNHLHLPSVIKTADGLFELLEGCQRMVCYYQNTKFESKKALWRKRVQEVVGSLAKLFSGEDGKEYERMTEQAVNTGHGGGGRVVLGYIPERTVGLELLKKLRGSAAQDEDGATDKVVEEEELRLEIQSGDFNRLDRLLSSDDQSHIGPNSDPTLIHLHLLRLVADRQFTFAVDSFLPLVQERLTNLQSSVDLCLVNNLSIALLYSGKLIEAFEMMDKALLQLGASPSEEGSQPEEGLKAEGHGGGAGLIFEHANPSRLVNALLFNHSTLLELRFGLDADQRKRASFRRLVPPPHTPRPLLRLLDLVSPHSLKLPIAHAHSL